MSYLYLFVVDMVTVTIFVCQFLAGFLVAVLRDTWLVDVAY